MPKRKIIGIVSLVICATMALPAVLGGFAMAGFHEILVLILAAGGLVCFLL